MTTNMDFLMKLYLMNIVQQQQQQIALTNHTSNRFSPATPITDPIANSNYLQQLYLQNALESIQNISNNLNTNFQNNTFDNVLFSSTVTSTPTSSFEDNDSKINSNNTCLTKNLSSNNLSTPSSISSDDKSLLMDNNGLMLSPCSMSTPKSKASSFESSDSCPSFNQENNKIQISSLQLFSSSSTDNLTKEENLKNVKKFSSFLDCEQEPCRMSSIREHFHCYETPCEGKVLTKKEDIIRHLKWHKKRKESLNFGFLRFSSSDDCSQKYGPECSYCFKQTHYHCIESNCSKVYVSTSDVQMHANFHRKNSEIIQEGFQRFRAIENCKTSYCPFSGKNISHYHCKMNDCQHTFKNKADIDKHKTYHLKDVQLSQDGYKKILKTETCPFSNCKFSTLSNHIHCIRENCNYILHSSSQLLSHKRKHEKHESQHLENKTQNNYPEIYSTPVSTISSSNSSFLSRKRGRPSKNIESIKKIKVEQATLEQPSVTPNVQLTHLMALFQLQNPLLNQSSIPTQMDIKKENN